MARDVEGVRRAIVRVESVLAWHKVYFMGNFSYRRQ